MTLVRFLLLIVLTLGVVFVTSLATEPEVAVTLNVALSGQPADALIRIIQNDWTIGVEYTDVHTPGLAQFQLPQGDYTLSIEHGAGFTALPKKLTISVKPGSPVSLAIEIERLIEPGARGYYSADLHAHTIASVAAMERDFGIRNHGMTPVDQMIGVQLAADLDVMFISDHNSSEGHEPFVQTAQERGVPFVLSEEITTLRWGHFNPYALRPGEVVEFRVDKLPEEYFEEARAKGAKIIQVNHPLDPMRGYLLLRNRPEFDPSFDAAEVFNGSFGEDDLQTILQMFRFWNEGKHYVATASSDDHDWKELSTQYGTPRTYVFVEGGLSAEKFLEALQAGHAFVTYGPMLFLTANGSAIPGDTVQLRSGEKIYLKADIQSVLPLEGIKAKVVRNGERLQDFTLSGLEQTITFEEAPTSNSWYVMCLVDPKRNYLAMTNPIWIEVSR